jgi:hypothetical protein
VFIERAELDEHYDSGRFPGLRIPSPPLQAKISDCAHQFSSL